MEFVLLIVAGCVVYYLYITFQEYLKNPLVKKPADPKDAEIIDVEALPAQSVDDVKDFARGKMAEFAESELGVMLEIMHELPNRTALGRIYDVANQKLIDDFYSLMHVTKIIEKTDAENFVTDLKNVASDPKNVLNLSKNLLNITYGEYKKRLKIVEFFLALLYADGDLTPQKNEFLLDIASSLALDNADFNALYADFEENFKNFTPDPKIDVSDEKIRENLLNIFDLKTHAVSLKSYAQNLRQICVAQRA